MGLGESASTHDNFEGPGEWLGPDRFLSGWIPSPLPGERNGPESPSQLLRRRGCPPFGGEKKNDRKIEQNRYPPPSYSERIGHIPMYPEGKNDEPSVDPPFYSLIWKTDDSSILLIDVPIDTPFRPLLRLLKALNVKNSLQHYNGRILKNKGRRGSPLALWKCPRPSLRTGYFISGWRAFLPSRKAFRFSSWILGGRCWRRFFSHASS
jgi:hypothetical protein